MDTYIRPIGTFLQSHKSLKWRRISDFTTRRNVDCIEAFYDLNGSLHAPDGRRRFDISTSLKLSLENGHQITERQAVEAWIALRRRHPALASHVHHSKRTYPHADEEELHTWCDETFVDVEDETSMTPAFLNSHEATSRPTLYFLGQSQTFILRCPHHCIDGLGIILLLNDFIEELSRILTATEKEKERARKNSVHKFEAPLSRPLRAVTRTSFPPLRLLRRLRADSKEFLETPSITIIPDRDGRSNPLSTWADLEYSPAATQEIHAATHHHGLTITDALHAALAVAILRHGEFPSGTSYSGHVVIDLRRRVAKMTGLAASDLVANHHTFSFVVFPVTDFAATAAELKQRYEAVEKDDDLAAMVDVWFLGASHLIARNMRQCYRAPVVSSWGDLDQIVPRSCGPVVVEDLAPAVEMCGPEVFVTVWTAGGKLRLRINYNEAFYSAETMKRLTGLVREVLAEGLQLDLGAVEDEVEADQLEANGVKADEVKADELANGLANGLKITGLETDGVAAGGLVMPTFSSNIFV